MVENRINERVRIVTDNDQHTAEVILDRADKMNAVDFAMFEALGEAADVISKDASVRAVVLRGAGDNFCAGIDLSALANSGRDLAAVLSSPVEPSAANVFQRAAYAWRELPVPVICAVQGVAFGAGMQIALGTDLRFAAPDARFSIMESKWGIIPDMGLTATLRQLVAPDKVKELAWTARILKSDEAAALGLITAVVDDPLVASRECAANCAAKSPDAIRGIKMLINEGWRGSERESLALEARLQLGIIGQKNQREAVAANLEKRKPEFKD